MRPNTTGHHLHVKPAAIVDPKAHADLDRIHAAYTWARANNPLGIAEIDGYDPFWVVTKHADLIEIARDGEAFHNGDRSAIAYPRATTSPRCCPRPR